MAKKTKAKKTTQPKSKVTVKTVSKKVTVKTPEKKSINNQTSLLKDQLANLKGKANFSVKPWLLVVLALLLLAFMFRDKLIVATVNGKPITRFALIKELEKSAGRQTLDSLVTQTLVYQEAEKQKVDVSATELDAEVAKIEENITAQGQDLDTLLEAQGMSRTELREQIKIQKIVEKIVGQGVEVSDDEVASYMVENADFKPADVDEAVYTEQVKDQLLQQKISEKIQTWLQEIRTNANIKMGMYK